MIGSCMSHTFLNFHKQYLITKKSAPFNWSGNYKMFKDLSLNKRKTQFHKSTNTSKYKYKICQKRNLTTKSRPPLTGALNRISVFAFAVEKPENYNLQGWHLSLSKIQIQCNIQEYKYFKIQIQGWHLSLSKTQIQCSIAAYKSSKTSKYNNNKIGINP